MLSLFDLQTRLLLRTRPTIDLGRTNARKTVTVDDTDTELVVACDDGSAPYAA